jgi:hypothetical protein
VTTKEFYGKALLSVLPTAVEITESPEQAEQSLEELVAETAHGLAFELTMLWQAQLLSFNISDQEHKGDPDYIPSERDLLHGAGDAGKN